MKKEISKYTHPKKGKLQFSGGYSNRRGDRYFYLKHPKTGQKTEFSSPAAAINAGWKKVN